MTVALFLDEWLETSVKPSVRPRTYDSYASHVRLYLAPGVGRYTLARLGPHHVQRLLNELLDGGLSPRTVLHVRATLRRALGQAMKWGLLERNVAAMVDPPRAPARETKPLTPEQARTFLAHVRGDAYEPLYNVALGLGLRQGELLGLRWDDVDLDQGALTVRHALQRRQGSWQLVEPKTERVRRTLPIPESIRVMLREHRAAQSRQRLRAGAEWESHGFVFTTSRGTPLDGCNVTHRFQRTLAEAGLPRQLFHDLRHACATFLLAQGLSPRVVMETLGHSNIGITMDTYAHVMPALQREAADRMDQLLTGGSTAG